VGGRTRVAVVVDRIHDYQVPVIRGVESVLHAAGAAFVVIVSHPLHSQQDTMLGLLVRAGLLHGVVVTPMPDVFTRQHRVARTVKSAAGIPAVTLGVEVPGVPVVLSANAGGVRMALAHLLDECGRIRPILITGTTDNDDFSEREKAFRDFAAERELDLPEVAVLYGGYERDHAYRRTIKLLAAGRDFDAILAANDDMAMGVLDALNERSVRVPAEVAVIGFDNIAEAYRTNPPLTSVDIELWEQGRAAARLVLAQLEGRPVADIVRPAAQLVVRGSSWPGSVTDLAEATLSGTKKSVSGRDGSSSLLPIDHVLAAIAGLATTLDPVFQKRLQEMGLAWIPAVIAGTLSSEHGETLGPAILELVVAHPEPTWWRSLTVTVQVALTASLPDEQAAVVSHVGVLRMALHIDRALAAVREQRDREQLALSEHVLEMNRALSGCISLPELTREVAAYLPRLNIRRCFLVLLDQHVATPERTRSAGRTPEDTAEADCADSTETADTAETMDPPRIGRVVLSYRDRSFSTEPERTEFNINQLLPPSLADELEHGTLTVQPLFSAERWFGFVLHEQNPIDRHTGEALRLDASRVLDSIARAKELTERASVLEVLVSERTEQLELEVANRRAAQENLHAANSNLRQALLLDGLTGLQNRPSFDEQVNRAWHQHMRSREPFSVLMVDVDHFKLYNDTYGHLAGDACLRQVASHLQAAVPRKQDVVARFGGEEFAIILPGTGAAGAFLVADRVLGGLHTAAIPHASSLHPSRQVSVSIGVGTTSTAGVDSVAALLEIADQAMYEAKRGGRDQVRGVRDPVVD
jgi:diguanylate cyclase (GGDEF)-like protein